MQRTLLTLALVAAAGTAVAQTANPPAAGSGSVTTPGASGATVTPPSTSAGAATTPGAKPSMPSQATGAAATPGMTPSATMNPPSASAGAAATPGMNQPSPGMNQPSATYGANTANASPRQSGQAGIAQKRIEADGYKNVQGLAKGSDGLWHGRAMRGNAEVQVTVDRRGNVSQQ